MIAPSVLGGNSSSKPYVLREQKKVHTSAVVERPKSELKNPFPVSVWTDVEQQSI
jgi:hypothetical protein